MQELVTFSVPTKAIVHFKEDEHLSAQSGRRLVHYQVCIDPTNKSHTSPDGEFIRFDSSLKDGFRSEIHGWVKADSVVIDTLLEQFEQGEWQEVAA